MQFGIFVMAILAVSLPFAFAENYSYSPLRDNQTPNGPYPTVQQIQEDFKLMANHNVKKIRTFESEDVLPIILREAQKNNISVIVGIDLINDQLANQKKITSIISKADKFVNVESYIIGENEIYDNTLTPDQLIEDLDYANNLTQKQISSINGFDLWNDNLNVINHVDYITADMFYQKNSNDPIVTADLISEKVFKLQKYGVPVMIETGWSTTISTKNYQEIFYDRLDKSHVSFLAFEWSNENWKKDPTEAGYGIVSADRSEKSDIVQVTKNTTSKGIEVTPNLKDTSGKILQITIPEKTKVTIQSDSGVKEIIAEAGSVIYYESSNYENTKVTFDHDVNAGFLIVPKAYAECGDMVNCYKINDSDNYYLMISVLVLGIIASLIVVKIIKKTTKFTISKKFKNNINKKYFEPITE